MRGTLAALAALALGAVFAEDAYLESDGTCGVNTRFRTCPGMKIEVDFACTDVADPTPDGGADGKTHYQMRIFGMDSTAPMASLYVNGSGNFSFGSGDEFKADPLTVKADLRRHRAILDYAAGTYAFLTDGATNAAGRLSSAARARTAARPIALFGNTDRDNGAVFSRRSKARIYRARIWRDGVLAHDYVPRVVDGFAGFRDLVDGAFVCGEGLNASALKPGGDIVSETGDGYIENVGGKSYIDTGYLFGPNTRVEADYSYSLRSNQPQQFVFEAGSEVVVRFYNNGKDGADTYLAWSCKDGEGLWTNTGIPVATNVRRRAILDARNRRVTYVTAGFTNYLDTATMPRITRACTKSLKLFCSAANVNANNSRMRLYGFRIYEKDVLVRDYAPCLQDGLAGLRDTLSGEFLPNGKGTEPFAVGGALRQDAFVEADGDQAVLTDFIVTPKTRIVADFQMTRIVGQMRIFGVVSDQNAELYVDGTKTNAGNFAFGVGDSWTKSAVVAADQRRHVATLDLARRAYSITTGGKTALAGTFGAEAEITRRAKLPLALFAKVPGSDGATFAGQSKARLYALRIYEADKLRHEYLPWRDGDAVGLRDTQTGKTLADGNRPATPLKHGGAGYEVFPKGGLLHCGETRTITAHAPGAVGYRWTCDGVTLDGETNGTLRVTWRRGKTGAMSYAVTPLYADSGEIVEGTAATAVVESVPKGGVVLLAGGGTGGPFKTIVTAPGALNGIKSHIQGIACTDDAIYLSEIEGLIKLDWSGKVLKRVEARRHMGGITVHDGKLYGTLGKTKDPNEGLGGTPYIQVFDAQDLTQLGEDVHVPSAPGIDGIAFLGDSFYVGGGRRVKAGVVSNTVVKLDRDLNFVKDANLDRGWATEYGVQNVAAADGKIWLFFYPAAATDPTCVVVDEDLNFLFAPDFLAGNGVDALPPRFGKSKHPRFLVCRTLGVVGSEILPPQAELRFVEVVDDKTVDLE